jgi:hypothetical protein
MCLIEVPFDRGGYRLRDCRQIVGARAVTPLAHFDLHHHFAQLLAPPVTPLSFSRGQGHGFAA